MAHFRQHLAQNRSQSIVPYDDLPRFNRFVFYYKLVTNSSHVILLSPFRCDTASLPAPPCSTVYKSISHAAAEVCEIFPNTAGEMFELMKPISQRRSLLLQLVPSQRIETEKLNPLLCFVSSPNTFVGSPAGHPAKPFFFGCCCLLLPDRFQFDRQPMAGAKVWR